MQMPKPQNSKGERLKTFFKTILRLQVVPNAPQLLPETGTHCPSSFIPLAHSPPEPPPAEPRTHRGDQSINGPTSDTQTSSSPPPTQPHVIPTTTTLFPGAHDFVINNFQRESQIVIRGMRVLSERVIKGSEYDSSLRDPPPHCHPGTRVQLMEKILAWFHNDGREKALLWLSGPAGVGKSAVIQTIAESFAKSNSVGATLFFSRLNDYNDPQRVFITLAYQLATRIPAYQIYVTERIALDPNLLGKGMRDQFRIFITEPFGDNGIGEGEGPWAVLLDGLDECEGVEEQSKIVRLVSKFVLKFPNAPLRWAIASRPEPHIVATFNDEAVAPSHWSEYVPINSTQACRDVEHYLDASFKAMRKRFPHLRSNWPSESQFLKLTNGALGLFVFAKTAVRFMEDPNYADPVSRLNLLLSIIDRLDIKLIDDHPFALLDALYAQILTSIPSSVWCTTKQLLGFVTCVMRPTEDGFRFRREFSGFSGDGLSYPLKSGSRSLMGTSVIFGLELSAIYSSLHKLHSVLDIPDSKEAHESTVTFLHASFGDYLTDRVRSKDFYIDRGEIVDDISRNLFQLYLDKPWTTEWSRYTPQFPAESEFFEDLWSDAEKNLEYVLTGKFQSDRGRGPLKSQQDRSDYLDTLSRLNLADVYGSKFHGAAATLLIELWEAFREELESTGQFGEVLLRDLKVDHLDYKRNRSAFASKRGYLISSSLYDFELRTSQLREHLMLHPERLAVVYGSGPENRIVFFAGRYNNFEGYFCLPYPY